jgi:hypothetical protein
VLLFRSTVVGLKPIGQKKDEKDEQQFQVELDIHILVRPVEKK